MTMTPGGAPLRRSPTFILACAWALGIGGTTMMPLLVTNAIARLHLDEGKATMLAGAEMVGMLAGCVVLPPLARRAPRRMAAAALLMLALCQAASAMLLPAVWFGVLRLAAGFCEAQMIVMVGICLAGHRDADRLWGWVLLLSGLAAAGAFTLLTLFPGAASGPSIWQGLALMTAALGMVAVRLPSLMPGPAMELGVARRRNMARIWLAWGVFVGVYSVQAGVWAVSALQGERIGLTLPRIGVLLSVSSLLGFFGAMAPAIPALAARRGWTVIAALAVMAGAVACFFIARDAALFFVGQLMLNAAFYTIMAVLNSFISAQDRDGTLLSRSVVVTFAAVALGTVGAGKLFQDAGAAGVIGFALLVLATCAPLGHKALRTSRDSVSASPWL